MSDPIRLVVAGGGTAGHISPMLAIADAVRQQDTQANIVALGSPAGLKLSWFPKPGIG